VNFGTWDFSKTLQHSNKAVMIPRCIFKRAAVKAVVKTSDGVEWGEKVERVQFRSLVLSVPFMTICECFWRVRG